MVTDEIEILDLRESHGTIMSGTERYSALSGIDAKSFVVDWTAFETPPGLQDIGAGVAYIEKRRNGDGWDANRYHQEIIACGDNIYAWRDNVHSSSMLLIIILPVGFAFTSTQGDCPIPLMAKVFNERMALCWNLAPDDTLVAWEMSVADPSQIRQCCQNVNRSGVAAYERQLRARTTPDTTRQLLSDASKGDGQFDVFLAHNSKDKPAVARLAEEIARRGLRPWLDSEQISPGQSFQDAIQVAIQNVRAVAICIGSEGLGKWQSLELKAAISKCINRGIPVIPVLLPGVTVIPDSLPFIAEFNWVKFEASIDEPIKINLLIWGITSRRPGDSADVRCIPVTVTPALATATPSEQRTDSGKPGRSGKVLFGLHGIRTHADWNRALYEVASDDAWQVRTDRWNFGYFNVFQFLTPWARSAKVTWFRQAYRDETHDRKVLLDESQYPSIIAHSFGTYILGNAILKYDWLRFNRVILCGSILPIDFPWDDLIERGQIQAVRNEYGVKDVWSGLVRWFVAGTGPSGRRGFLCQHDRFEQEQFDYTHSEYFDKGHMESKWLPFINRNDPRTPATRSSVRHPKTTRPWCIYFVYTLSLCILLFAMYWNACTTQENRQNTQAGESEQPKLYSELQAILVRRKVDVMHDFDERESKDRTDFKAGFQERFAQVLHSIEGRNSAALAEAIHALKEMLVAYDLTCHEKEVPHSVSVRVGDRTVTETRLSWGSEFPVTNGFFALLPDDLVTAFRPTLDLSKEFHGVSTADLSTFDKSK